MSDQQKETQKIIPVSKVTEINETEARENDDNGKFSEVVLSAIFPEPGKVTLLGLVPQPLAATIAYPPPALAPPEAIPAPDPSKPELPYFDPTIHRRGVTHFVGRERVIKDLHHTIQSIQEPTRIVVLQGLGGQGKTAIAVQYAHRYGSSGYKLVFWVNASSERAMGSACHRIVRERKLIQGVEVITDSQAVDTVTRYLQSPEAECLILFDNFDALNPQEQGRIAAILPLKAQPRERVTIVMTSRNLGASAFGRTLRIEGMTEKDAMELLLYRWSPDQPILPEQHDACKQILKDVGYLPLAIEQAGAYLHETSLDPREYLDFIKTRREEVINYIPQNYSYRRFALDPASEKSGDGLNECDDGPYITAFVTWDWSMKAIGGGDDKTPLRNVSTPAKLLRLAAFLSREHLPSTFFSVLGERSLSETSHFLRWLKTACSNKKGQWKTYLFKKDVISKLTSLFLIAAEPTPQDPLEFELITHPLVQEWARLQRPPKHITYFFEAAIELVKCHMQPDNFDVDPEVKDTILHQLDAIVSSDEVLYDYEPPLELPVCLGRGRLVPITFKFASFYLDYGIYEQAHSLYTRIIKRNPNSSNDDERHIVFEAMEGLAIVELLQGKFRDAERHCRAALRGYGKLPATYQASRFRALHNLGEICGAQQKFSEILVLFKESLEGSQKLHGDKDILTLREVEAYANAHRVLRMYDEASALYEQAIDGMKAFFQTDDHPDLLGAIEGLAIVRKGQERYDEAEANYKIALEGDLEHLGENHPDTINVVEGLSDVYVAQQMTALALEKYEQVKQARIMVVGDKHPDTIRITRKINEVLHPTGTVDFVHDTAYYPWYRAITSGDFDTALSEEELENEADPLESERLTTEGRAGPPDHPATSEDTSHRDPQLSTPAVPEAPQPQPQPTCQPRTLPVTVRPRPQLVLFDERDTSSPGEKTAGFAEDFFDEFRQFRDMHKSYWGSSRRIKVAVLDTGINKHEAVTRGLIDEIEKQRGKKGRHWNDGPIKKTQSFVGDDDGEDTCGHGTRVAQLILRLAPQADLYVAKISKGLSDEDESSGDNIARAIKSATNQGVDIITMSFGLAHPDTRVRDALDKVPRSCTLFAAASNWGGNRGRPFPANDSRVICIHASDGHGYDSSGLNPPLEGCHDAWTTLGVDIKFQWDGKPVWKSGTSYATPIAVAIVVNAMDYVNRLLEKGKLTETRRDSLFRDDGVRQMLHLMSKKMGGFNYIVPWKLWPAQHWDSGADDEEYVSQLLASDRL